MEPTRQSLKGGRQLPLQQGLIREMREEKESRQREPEDRQQTVGTVKIWSVVE